MSPVKYVLKLVFGPWERTFKCAKREKIAGAFGFGTKEEALDFCAWLAMNAERLKEQMRDEAKVAKAPKRTPRS